ncbi:MAG: sigma-54-dependent transcriptional regulator [Acidobacteriota bacterium]
MKETKILVIDDESGIRSSLKGIFEDEGYSVETTSSGENGLDKIKTESFDLVLLDIWLPEMNGIEVLEKIKDIDENIQVVMITGHGSVEAAVKSTKLGAYDFLEKPLSLEKVVLTAKNALKRKSLEEENIQLRQGMKSKTNLIGKTKSMQKIREKIQIAAPTDGRVLIYGEHGTGKKLLARLTHQLSKRRRQSFIQINVAAIPDDLIESELFGRSLDSGKSKKGKLIMANKGTLFLDEIGELSLRTQDRLIKFIEENKYEPLETSKSVETDVRIMASTHHNLRDLIAENKFREELFFKLNVIPIKMPPLRQRKEDIPLLINYFLKYFSSEYGKKQKTMDKKAMEAFINYSWPGNISELINVIERFVIMVKEDEINSSHLYLLVEPIESEFLHEIKKSISLKKARENFDKEFIHHALVRNNWNLDKAATELEIEKKTLQSNIKRLGIHFSK